MRRMTFEFREVVTSEAAVREALGAPSARMLAKERPALDAACRAFLSQCRFALVASADAAGHVDVSPKGDPAGFVAVLDERTLAIPERPGNRRADTLRNVVQRPQVGLLFLIPGKGETLRVNGTAIIVRDEWLRARMAVEGKLPALALVVTVREAFFHCPKCVARSALWDAAQWPREQALAGIPRIEILQPLY